MYDRDLTQQNIDETAKKLGQPIYRYTFDYIQQAKEHLQSLAVLDDKGRKKELKRDLLPDESLFIRNERLLCALDYDHWSENYHRVRDSNTQQMVPFKRNFGQNALNEVYCEMEAAKLPIMLQVLKARQLGVTTDTESRIQHRAQFIPNTSGVLASSDEDKTWKLSEMISRSLLVQPWWLIPDDWKQYQSGEVFVESATRNMTIAIQHGRQTSGIARGDTINCYQLSELPDFTDAESLVDAGLMKAMHPTHMTLGVEESTANGRNDWWHKRWKKNLKLYAQRRGLVQPAFLPWYVGTDIYPTRDWLAGVPIPEGWEPPGHIVEHAVKAKEYVAANRILYRVLGLSWEMPLEQMWFYYIEHQNAKAEGELALAKFYSEMPANDLEAFQSKLGMVFSIELLQSYQNKARAPLAVYGIQGEQVPAPLWPEATEIDPLGIPLRVVYPVPRTGDVMVWNLTPVKRDLTDDGMDRLIIWELPEKGSEYGVGLDGAEGKGLDRTVLPVVKKGTPLSPAVQVAELATDKVATLEIWPVWLMLLKLYSPVYQGEYTHALAAPEMNKGGDAALMQIRNLGWPNFYTRYAIDNFQRPTTPKMGWETTPKSRDQLVQWILMIIKGHWVEVNSPYLIDELRDFVVNQLQTKVRLEHGYGSHDDRIFAFIILLVCLQGIDVYKASTPHWMRVQEDVSALLSFPVNRGLFFPVDDETQLAGGVEVVYVGDSEEG